MSLAACCEKRLMQDPPRKAAMPTRLLTLMLTSACVVGACLTRTEVAPVDAVDLNVEKESLLRRDNEWHIAVAEKEDIAKITSFFASDGILIGTGQTTATGRAALTEAVEALVSGPDFQDEWEWDRVELSPDGKLAYLVGKTSITVSDADGRPKTSRARLLNVWRKDPDGIWRCVVDMWVDEPPTDTQKGN